jgi:WD40 repeat protein
MGSTYEGGGLQSLQKSIGTIPTWEVPSKIHVSKVNNGHVITGKKNIRFSCPTKYTDLTMADNQWILSTTFNEKKEFVVANVHTRNESENGRITTSNHLLLWNPQTACKKTFNIENLMAYTVSHDGTRIILANDNTIYILDISTGDCIGTIPHNQKLFFNSIICLSRDGQKLVEAGCDHIIKLWNLTILECQQVFRGHFAPITIVEISNDCSRVVSADFYDIRIWDSSTGQCLQTTPSVNSISIKFSDDDSSIVCLIYNTYFNFYGILIIDMQTFQKRMIKSTSKITSFGFYPVGYWNRNHPQRNYCRILNPLTILASNNRNQEIPLLPTEMWEYIFRFIYTKKNIITIGINGIELTSTKYEL